MNFMSNPTLEICDLACERQERWLFQQVNFELNPGEILQVVGANGSGKTSLLRILSGLLVPDSGEIRWQGIPVSQCREAYLTQLNYIGHQAGITGNLTVAENLRYAQALSPLRATVTISQALQQVMLADYAHLPAYKLSAGQTRRLALARLLLRQTQLWILDEPLNALDVNGIEIIHHLIAQQIERQGMVIVTSHQSFQFSKQVIRQLTL